jgi:hypothetical protein
MKKIIISLFGGVTLFLMQCSAPPLQGQIIYNSELFEAKPVLLNLTDMSEEIISLPASLQGSIVEMTGTLDLFRPTFDKFAWSNNGEELAFPCMPKDNIKLTICIWNKKFLTLENPSPSQTPVFYQLAPNIPTGYPSSLIWNMSWSPHDEKLIVTARWYDNLESPCLIDNINKKVECGVNNDFWKDFSEDILQVLTGAFVIEWSPTDVNKMAIPLRKNWLRIFEDGYVIVSGEQGEYAVERGTGNYTDGIYIVDLQHKTFQPIWNATDDERIDIHNKILWSPNGQKIAFVYAEDVTFSAPTYVANYVVGMVNTNGKNFTILFDSQELTEQMKKKLPENILLPSIFLADWSSDGRYLLFEVNFKGENSYNSFIGAFVYDIKAGTFQPVIEFIAPRNNWLRLNPDWNN